MFILLVVYVKIRFGEEFKSLIKACEIVKEIKCSGSIYSFEGWELGVS